MKRLICTGLCLLLLLAGGCGRLPGATRSGFALDTVVSVTLYGTDDEALLDGCFALIREKEALFSRTVPDSDVARINAAAGQPVTVTEETAALLRTALIFCEASGGAFDVTVGALTQLWDFGADTPFLPAADAVTTALATVSYAGLSVKGNTVTLVNKDARLDLGGIAKGYIADCLRDYLTQHGVTSALLDLGGSITVLGDKQGKPFRIGIRAPDDADGLLGVVPVCGGHLWRLRALPDGRRRALSSSAGPGHRLPGAHRFAQRKHHRPQRGRMRRAVHRLLCAGRRKSPAAAARTARL